MDEAMIELAGKFIELEGLSSSSSGLRRQFRVTSNPALPHSMVGDSAWLCRGDVLKNGFPLYLAIEADRSALNAAPENAARAVLPESARYLADGDVIRISPLAKEYRVVFRHGGKHNSILLTQRCNHYCLMCSQPPRDANDDWLIAETEQLLQLIPTDASELVFTGGEPTLYGDRLISLLKLSERLLPRTAIHLLSNGRRFADPSYADAYARVKHHDLMVGIPLYSDDPSRHNYVVQADGAFDETVAGILNLKRRHQRVEMRVVLHAQTIERLPRLAEFIARNILFVDQVALMGLEITGFGRSNLETLWIDPYDYRETLEEAVSILSAYRVPVRVYNHQLCVVTPFVRRFCVKSISDWKNEYLPQCAACELRNECGGFFSTQVKYRHSDHIEPVPTPTYKNAAACG